MVSPLPVPPSVAQPHYPPHTFSFFLLENKVATKINKNEIKRRKEIQRKTIRNTYKYRETHTLRNPL